MTTHTLHGFEYIPRILRLDRTGHPIGWISWQVAVCLYARNIVSWGFGDFVFRIKGGFRSHSGERSHLDIHSIIACNGRSNHTNQSIVPPVSNAALFERDRHFCLYCGDKFADRDLTRDHLVPRSRGGRDTWMNLVTACKRCNHRKGNRLLDESELKLLATPYVPNPAEYLALVNSSRILGDQLEFLESRYNSKRRAHLAKQLSPG